MASRKGQWKVERKLIIRGSQIWIMFFHRVCRILRMITDYLSHIKVIFDLLTSIYCEVFYKLRACWTILTKHGLFRFFCLRIIIILCLGMLPKTPFATMVTVKSCVDSCTLVAVCCTTCILLMIASKEKQRPSVARAFLTL